MFLPLMFTLTTWCFLKLLFHQSRRVLSQDLSSFCFCFFAYINANMYYFISKPLTKGPILVLEAYGELNADRKTETRFSSLLLQEYI